MFAIYVSNNISGNNRGNGKDFGGNRFQGGNKYRGGGGNFSRERGKSSYNTGRYCRSNSINKPHCQLCGRTGHTVMSCWHRFDQNFQP